MLDQDTAEGRERIAEQGGGNRAASLLVWAVVPLFLGVAALANDALGWAIGAFALAAVLLVPGLIGWVTADR